jgi:hypothetical protein
MWNELSEGWQIAIVTTFITSAVTIVAACIQRGQPRQTGCPDRISGRHIVGAIAWVCSGIVVIAAGWWYVLTGPHYESFGTFDYIFDIVCAAVASVAGAALIYQNIKELVAPKEKHSEG